MLILTTIVLILTVMLILIVVLIRTVMLVMKVMIGLARTHLCSSSGNGLRATKGIIMGWGCCWSAPAY